MNDAELLARAAALAREDSPAGYVAFYTLVQGVPPPRHARKWVEDIFAAKEQGKGLVIEAFRGSTKTTTLTILFLAHRIGLLPDKSCLLIQVNDTSAKKNAAKVADIIESSGAWRAIFPHVVKDDKRGWGEKGYWVRDTRVPDEQWSQALGIDPTFVGWGYSSGSIVGMHPTNVLVIDDIHDEENTSSARQLEGVMDIIKGTIMPTLVPGAFHIVVGTPWVEGDAISYFKALPLRFLAIRTPVMEGGKSVWPEVFTEEEIEARKQDSGEVEFARMYLLDLEAAKGHILKAIWLGEYPAEDIKNDWARFIGVDYASASDKQRHRERDDCVICWGALSPRGELIVEDGYAELMSQAESYQRLIATVSAMPTLQQAGVESIGKGEEFYELLQSAPVFMPLLPIESHKGLSRSKGGRFEKVLAPLFQRRRVLLSTRDTPFLGKFRNQWVSWDGSQIGKDDCLDGVYMMVRAAEGFIAIPSVQVSSQSPLFFEKKRQPSPWAALGSHDG